MSNTTNLGLQWEIAVVGRVLPMPWRHARQNGQIGNWFLSLGRQTWIDHQLWWRYRVRKSSRHIWDRGNKCDRLSNELSENGKKINIFSEMRRAKRLRDWSIVLQLSQKLMTVGLRVLYEYWTWNCFRLDLQNWKDNFRFDICPKHVCKSTNNHLTYSDVIK